LGKARRLEVGGADEAQLARLHELAVGRERLLLRRGLVVAVGLEEVDAVGVEPLQRILGRALDVRRRQALADIGHVHAALGGDQHLVALGRVLLQPRADHGLGFAALVAGLPARIDVGGVDEGEAGIDEGVEDLVRGGLVGRPAKDVAAEGDWGEFEARPAGLGFFHGPLPLRIGPYSSPAWPGRAMRGARQAVAGPYSAAFAGAGGGGSAGAAAG